MEGTGILVAKIQVEILFITNYKLLEIIRHCIEYPLIVN